MSNCYTAGEGATHHAGCECHEARLAETIARLTAERDKARDQLATAQVIIAEMESERDTARELRAALTAERDEARASLATVRAQVNTMIAVHDEVEARAERAEAEVARQSAARVAVDAAEGAELARLRALLASWLDDDDDGALWSDWPKRLSEDQREALACAWTGLPPGSCWVRAALATGEKGGA